MTSDQRTSFLTYYIRSLAERTRVEKTGTKFGFDWVIYNLALAADWTPQRLPFQRGAADEYSKTKTESEYGVDFAFLSNDRHTLYVFVLKDEVLNNQNWGKHSFDIDLRKAAAPDRPQELRDVREVHILLAYNKDEVQAGVELFDRLTASLGTKIWDDVTLSFERWNLTTITEKAGHSLLTPSLLPQAFFSQFGYLCSQFEDFIHGSEQWTHPLVPNWRRFLDELLKDEPDERSVRLLPVALIILHDHSGKNPTAATGWIELIEWAMLAAWRVHQTTSKARVRQAVQEMWLKLYVAELSRFYRTQQTFLAVEGGLDKYRGGGVADAVASAMVSHWHVARLGILSIALSEIHHAKTKKAAAENAATCNAVANILSGLLNANSSATRPVLDIQHIEMFLIWVALWKVGRYRDISLWLLHLQNCLFMRRIGKAGLPFIDGYNSLESVFEYAATGECPPEYCDGSSVFLACMLELCFSLPTDDRDHLLTLIYQRLVLGNADDGQRFPNCEPIDLMLWTPPDDWGERVLVGSLANEGNCITIHYESISPPNSEDESLGVRISRFVEISRKALPFSARRIACFGHYLGMPETWHSLTPRIVEAADLWLGAAKPARRHECGHAIHRSC